jgi:hypothetical protein
MIDSFSGVAHDVIFILYPRVNGIHFPEVGFMANIPNVMLDMTLPY